MRHRCICPTCAVYPYYGGRGITVCERWQSFENFIADMGLRPGPGYSLDRWPDADGNYEPGNVRWATSREQSRNRRSNRWVDYKGERIIVNDLAARVGLDYRYMLGRLNRGWSVERAADTPILHRVDRRKG